MARPSSKRSTQPTSSPQTPSRPVSSHSSRTTASASSSPASTRPPGTDHCPRPARGPAGSAAAGRASTTTAPTRPAGRSARRARQARPERPVHDDGPGHQPEAPRRSSWWPGRRAGPGVDADAAPLPGPGEHGVHHRLPDADAAGVGLDEEVLDHAPAGRRRAAARRGDGVADDGVVDGARPARACRGRPGRRPARARRARPGRRRGGATRRRPSGRRSSSRPPRPAAEAGEVGGAWRCGPPARVGRPSGRPRSQLWSWAILFRIVLRPRWAAS